MTSAKILNGKGLLSSRWKSEASLCATSTLYNIVSQKARPFSPDLVLYI